MTKIKGYCRNIDGCDLAADKVEQEAEKSNFVCSECGKPLTPIDDHKGGSKAGGNGGPNKILIIGIVAAVVIIGGILFAVFSGGDESTPTPKNVAVATVDSDSIARANADAELQKEKARADSLAKVAENAQAKSSQPAAAPVAATPKQSQPTPKATQSSNGKLRLSYGSYSGDTKNGYPDGMGRLTYSSSRQINRFDSKRRMASAGDYVIGEFVRGFFVQGKHFDSDGNLIETLMIGTPANDSYDSK